MMFSSSIIIVLLLALVWYAFSKDNNNKSFKFNKNRAPVIIGIVVAVLVIFTVIPALHMFPFTQGYNLNCFR
ncbi:hypothetical protein [Companilactobacillus keshanensis]|uniref:Uncharacterized protein n=1 Tax=Companilactobacillus keshanensis TaxID=2486003 RepID=A0ABW4BWH4_9LACO|nr:hypothetical protein [Companilactobacillus keshanensis]